MNDDQQLRDELQRAVPRTVNTPAWSEIETRGRRARRRRRSVLAVATTVVLLAVGAGGFALWDALRPAATLLITDEMPVGTGTIDPERSQLLSDIQALMSRLDRGELVIDWPPANAAEGADGLSRPYWSASQALYALGQQVLQGDAHVDIYLKDGVEQEAARQLADEVRSTSGVVWVKYVSKDEALARLKEDLKDHPQVLADLPTNPLPASIEAFVPDLTDRKRLAESMSARAEVDEVRYPEAAGAASIQILREAFQQLQERARPAGSTSSTAAPPATDPNRSTTTEQRLDVDGPIDPALDIPMPYLDEAYYYRGDGRFVTASGREFFWRNGRFENRDGSLLEVPESVNDKLTAAGMPPIDAQPTRPTTTSP